MTSKQDLRYRKETDVARSTTLLSSYASAKLLTGSLMTTTYDQTSSITIVYGVTTVNLTPFRYVETSTFGDNIIVKIRYGLGVTNIPSTNFTLTLQGNTDLGIGLLVIDQAGLLHSNALSIVSMNSPISCTSSGPHVPGYIDVWYTKVQVIEQDREAEVAVIGDLRVTEKTSLKQDLFIECPQCGRESMYKHIVDKQWCYCPIHGWQDITIVNFRNTDPEGTIYSASNGRPIYNTQTETCNLDIVKRKRLTPYRKGEKNRPVEIYHSKVMDTVSNSSSTSSY